MRIPNFWHRLKVSLDARRVRRRGDPEHHQLSSLILPGQTAIDVGANHGVYTYSLMRCGAVVHAIEPNPLLAARLRGARLPRVTVHEAAVGDQSQEGRLFVPRHHKGRQNDAAGSLVPREGEGEGWLYTVNIISIDDLNLENVAFIKVDVEGLEEKVISGAWKTILRDRPRILIELEEKISVGCRDRLVSKMRTIDYSTWFFDKGDWRDERNLGRNQITDEGRYINNFLFSPGTLKPLSNRY